MKKLLIGCLALVACISAQAQGTFTFNNNTATRITNSTTGSGAVGITVAVYYNSNTNLVTTQTDGPLTIDNGAITNTIANGTFIGGTRTIPTVGEQGSVAFQIRAWSGGFADWDSAFAAAQSNSSILVGKSVVFVLGPLGGPGGTPTPSIFGAGKLNQFNVAPLAAPVPEPSSIALGLLGLGAIALFRRRK